MNKGKTKKPQAAKDTQKRLDEAKKSYQKLQEEIAPFVKKRKFTENSTIGEWRETSSLFKRS